MSGQKDILRQKKTGQKNVRQKNKEWTRSSLFFCLTFFCLVFLASSTPHKMHDLKPVT